MKNLDILGYIVLFSIIGLIVYLYINNLSEFQLKCVVSDEDGNKYCVRERSRIDDAADLLAKTTQKCKDLVDYMKNKYPESDGNLCIYCENLWTYKRTIGTGKRVKHQTNFSIDRIDNNKTYQVNNLAFCCSGCNDKKHHATLELMENVLKVAKEKGLR